MKLAASKIPHLKVSLVKRGDDQEFGGEGCLSWSMKGKKTIDVRLAAIAIRITSRDKMQY